MSAIDTVMDARMEGLSLLDEMVQHRSMMIYRTVFIMFGLILGWVLWQNNKREREFRDLNERMQSRHSPSRDHQRRDDNTERKAQEHFS